MDETEHARVRALVAATSAARQRLEQLATCVMDAALLQQLDGAPDKACTSPVTPAPDHTEFRALAERWQTIADKGALARGEAAYHRVHADQLLALCGAPVARSATREQVEGEIADYLAERVRVEREQDRRKDGESTRGDWLDAIYAVKDIAEDIRSGAYRADQPQPSEPTRTEPADFEKSPIVPVFGVNAAGEAVCRAGERPRQSEPGPKCGWYGCVRELDHSGACRGAPGAQRAPSRIDEYHSPEYDAMPTCASEVRAQRAQSGPSPENVARARELLRDARETSWRDDCDACIREALALLGGGDGGT